MDGHQYEYQCADILRKKGFANVKVTKGSKDQGIDVIAYSRGKKYGIQCKYYSSHVGNHAVQEAFAGARYYNCDVAAVMTNTTFTPAAKELARKTGVLLWGNNEVPHSSNSFWLTKFIGIFACVFGIMGLAAMRRANIEPPALQTAGPVFFILGGVCSVFEHRNYKISFLSGVFYAAAYFCESLFCFLADKVQDNNIKIYGFIAIASFIRALYLRNKSKKEEFEEEN